VGTPVVDGPTIRQIYSTVKIINLTSRPDCGLNLGQMQPLPGILVVRLVRESQALVARLIPFIRIEPGSG
jgi:hypothetical protein